MKINRILTCGIPQIGFYKHIGEILQFSTGFSILNRDSFIYFYRKLKFKDGIDKNFIRDVYESGKIPQRLNYVLFIHGLIDSIAILMYIRDVLKKHIDICENYMKKLKLQLKSTDFIAYFKPVGKKDKFEHKLHEIFKDVIKELNGEIYKTSKIANIIKNNTFKRSSNDIRNLSRYQSYE